MWACIVQLQRWAWFVVTLQLLSGCGGAGANSPTAPTKVSTPQPQPVSQFAVSGIVSEYRGGPLAGVTIHTSPNFPPGNGVKTTVTDANGFYRIAGLAEATSVGAAKDGFEPTGYGAFTRDQVINITMNRRLQVAAGQNLTATIWGDSALGVEDDSGANCDSDDRPCMMVHVITPGPGTLMARLTWNGQTELGVFISTGNGGQGARGSPPQVASLTVRGGETLVIVSFEKAGGARPIPGASQTFELATTFTPQ